MSQWGPLAAWGDRVVASLIDYLPVLVLNLLVINRGFLGYLVGLAGTVYGFYVAYMNGERGASPGKRITGLKVVRETDGQTIGGGMGIIRAIAHVIDSVICLIGYLFPLWDPKRQTLADKIIGTLVLRDQPKEPFSIEAFKL
jgi:uncharacterized RDD family membrane protein YckC